MQTLDTIDDFVRYLEKKEKLFGGPITVHAAGEEELLAIYLSKLNRQGEHDFIFPASYDLVSVPEGHYQRFLASPERQAQIKQDRISYAWDEIIQKFAHHLLAVTQYFGGHR